MSLVANKLENNFCGQELKFVKTRDGNGINQHRHLVQFVFVGQRSCHLSHCTVHILWGQVTSISSLPSPVLFSTS